MTTRSALLAPLVLALAGCCCGGGGYCEPSPYPTRWSPAAPPTAVAPAPAPPHRLEGPGWRGVILRPEGHTLRWTAVEGGLWDPTEADVRRLEAALPAALKAAVPDLAHVPSDYVRQYVGVLRDGRRKIEVRAALQRALDELEEVGDQFWTTVLLVNDGGDHYVDATWDVENGTFDDIGIHGEA